MSLKPYLGQRWNRLPRSTTHRAPQSVNVCSKSPDSLWSSLVYCATLSRTTRPFWPEAQAYELAKAGVLLMDLCSGSSQQQSDLLFEAPRVQRDRTQLMKAMDRINARYGKATVHMPAQVKRKPMMLLGA